MYSNYLSKKKKYFQANLIHFRANFLVQQSKSLTEKQVRFTLKTISHRFKLVVKWLTFNVYVNSLTLLDDVQ